MASNKFGKKPKPKVEIDSPTSANSLGLVPSSQDFGIAVDENVVETQCRSEIAKALGQNLGKLKLKPLEDSTQGFQGLYSIDGADMSQLEGKRVTPILRWFDWKEATYWLGFRLGFLRVPGRSGRYINTVSLTVARSFPSSPPEALLRAEWSYYAEEKNKPKKEAKEHAEPHWHVYKSSLNTQEGDLVLTQLLETPSDVEPPVIDFNPDAPPISQPSPPMPSDESPDRIHEFHFAMCAHWDRTHKIIQWPIAEGDVPHWIKHCLAYIRSELETKK